MPDAPLYTEPTHIEHAPDADLHFWTRARRHRLAWALAGLLLVVLLAVVPPLISISRYQRRVAASISGSLGRPVHFDNLTLHLLPLPGITIQNFVVGESPDFGAEPVMRANSVEARLRVSSLWRRRIEVSHISLDSPSINLVRRRQDGAWNLQSILMQASQMNSAPTAQASAGSAPRFPYIEATDARINIKSDNDKLPFAFKEADLALWLPEPGEWHLRLTGKPVRTDTDVSDVGLLRVDATLGRATDLASSPIDLSATWKPTPLGEAGKLTVGYDLGWRGAASAEATLKGTLGNAKLTADLHLLALRRADFVPEHTAEVNAHCEATTGGLLRSLTDLRCAIPTSSDTSMFAAIDFLRKSPALSSTDIKPATGPADVDAKEASDTLPAPPAKPGVILIRGDMPDLLDWHSMVIDATLQDADPNYALAWLRLFSRRTPRDLSIGGKLSVTLSRAPNAAGNKAWSVSAECECILPATALSATPSAIVDATGKPVLMDAPKDYWTFSLSNHTHAVTTLDTSINETVGGSGKTGLCCVAGNVTIGLGTIDRTGYRFNFTSAPSALQAAAWLPPLTDGMPTDGFRRLDAPSVERQWNGLQTWTSSTPAAQKPASVHHHRLLRP